MKEKSLKVNEEKEEKKGPQQWYKCGENKIRKLRRSRVNDIQRVLDSLLAVATNGGFRLVVQVYDSATLSMLGGSEYENLWMLKGWLRYVLMCKEGYEYARYIFGSASRATTSSRAVVPFSSRVNFALADKESLRDLIIEPLKPLGCKFNLRETREKYLVVTILDHLLPDGKKVSDVVQKALENAGFELLGGGEVKCFQRG